MACSSPVALAPQYAQAHAVPGFALVLVHLGTGMLAMAAAAQFTEDPILSPTTTLVVVAAAAARHVSLALFVQFAAVFLPPSSAEGHGISELLVASYVGHAILGTKDILLGIWLVWIGTGDVIGLAFSIFDPFLWTGLYATFGILNRLYHWKSAQAGFGVAALWAGDILGRVVVAVFMFGIF